MASLREAKPLTERKSLSQRGRASYREEGPLTGRPASHREAGPFTGIWASHREDSAEALTKSILNIFWKAGLVKKKKEILSIHPQAAPPLGLLRNPARRQSICGPTAIQLQDPTGWQDSPG